jgi:hypothetical protein
MLKHDWRKDEYGEIDTFALDNGYHNGPECLRCGETFCHHCRPEKMNEDCYNQTDYLPGT